RRVPRRAGSERVCGLVRRAARGRRPTRVEDCLPKAGYRERIRRRNSLWEPRRRRRALDRGISGRPLPPPVRHAAAHAVTRRNDALATDGLPFGAAVSPRSAGLLQSQGLDLRSRATQASVLCFAEVLQRIGEILRAAINDLRVGSWSNGNDEIRRRLVGRVGDAVLFIRADKTKRT